MEFEKYRGIGDRIKVDVCWLFDRKGGLSESVRIYLPVKIERLEIDVIKRDTCLEAVGVGGSDGSFDC